ncbi:MULTISPECIES: AmmeMemoRadiSam system protein B [Pseudothermotoga]|jgi:hypothetical protein|uniref:MEMO1 family protein Tlet_0497 n=1 Tax=Pseudothermotoga lettingae (strain ATCC BAA-301 / DSM 14385 / NBRC 107922 / TMO) TaxID=416591 RepID=A8F4I0_PSELT|nr:MULTISPECIES: AmmeMemoRadiSam system protein B [Pseudothermotoga]ABV33064.1 protein of unknown function DUF52 [Pseudothermotoga lettingae TMO]KUK22037.1 MAG: Uncharacterized protein XD56_0001 [Pseudothermotoga lettingae]MDI3494281.1 hypothetical protein [Pseudothermotoga sp.]MDK2884070.1 hypothetical protein [Pseudothermotoga sp.]GLI47934.1 MEMO1 family protein [Pseudothermotoga lettingae TMO]
MRRTAVAAGSFYPASPERLKFSIEEAFTSSLGPGHIPDKPDQPLKKHSSVIVPHAGYIYSGPVAAHAYAEISKLGKPELVVLVGPNHTGYGRPIGVYNRGTWVTPFGELHVSTDAAEIFLQYCDEANADFKSHISEHSIEVQLPFLQYLFDDFQILPIAVFPIFIKSCEKIAIALDHIAENFPSTLFVFTTDFNHYESDEITVKKDQMVIDKILTKDPTGLYSVVAKEKVTMCGLSVVTSFLFMKHFGLPRLLKHATSGDVTGERSQVVGYASFICESI